MPAYNASKTLEKTYRELPTDLVDEVILCDDFSTDETVELSQKLGIDHIIVHPDNRGYGANQKSLYKKALEINADIIIMVHPDYQYTPLLVPSIAYLIAQDLYDVVIASRILGKGALQGGMPIYKYVANRFLTFAQNLLIGQKLSEYHTGYRAFNRRVLEKIDLSKNDDDFVFDNEMLSQIAFADFRFGEVSCPTKYFEEASSINFKRSMKYGFGVLRVSIQHFFARLGFKANRYKDL